jgi:hypothetical protein
LAPVASRGGDKPTGKSAQTVRSARPGVQRIDLLVALDRLQRVARAGAVAAVVDQQRRPAVAGEAVGDVRGEGGLGGRGFPDAA